MKIVIFGLTVSSSWGNGHATLWRGLCSALAARSHRVVFFECDVPYYRMARDISRLERGKLVLYPSWESVRAQAARELLDADAAIVTSYCPDAVAATSLVLDAARPLHVFYDLDTPVTLAAVAEGKRPAYIGEEGLSRFDLVLSFTGGRALDALRQKLGARRVAPLYGHVDPDVHRPVRPDPRFESSLSYLGTYSPDRQAAFEELFLAPAKTMEERQFVLGGSMYPRPDTFPANVKHFSHVPPGEHGAFFCSSRLTLNLTRSTMAAFGHCPSGRLFEAAASGVPIVSDWFEGLDRFFTPGDELLVARSRSDVLAALDADDRDHARRALRARARVFAEHLAAHRAETLVSLLSTSDYGEREQRNGAALAPASTEA